MLVISSTPSQPDMFEAGRVEADCQKEIVIARQESNIPNTDDQPITEVCDQSETDDYEGFLDLGFRLQVVVPTVPLIVVSPDSYFERRFLR